MERRLGRGLGSLLGNAGTGAEAAAPGGRTTGSTGDLPLGSIEPNPFQPRKHLDPEGLEELAASLRVHGVLQPVVVRRSGGRYQLIAGERRWRAAHLAKLTRIPATVREDVSDQDMLELALVENVQRRDLNPLERALGYRQLMESLSITQEAVAEKVGLQRTTVTNHLRLLELPSKAQEAVAQGLVGMGHARALLGLDSPRAILELLQATVREDLSVREVERRVRDRSSKRTGAAAATKAKPKVPWVRALETRLRDQLGTQVELHGAEAGQGKVEIRFFSREELDRLCERLAPRDLL